MCTRKPPHLALAFLHYHLPLSQLGTENIATFGFGLCCIIIYLSLSLSFILSAQLRQSIANSFVAASPVTNGCHCSSASVRPRQNLPNQAPFQSTPQTHKAERSNATKVSIFRVLPVKKVSILELLLLWNSLVSLISLVGFAGNFGLSMITCSSSNGRGPDSVDNEVKTVEQLIEEKRRAELSARISSGEFTVNKSGYELWLQFCFC